MAILALQKQAQQIGRIRLGHTIAGTTQAGKAYTRPAKLETFRFTTHSRYAAGAVADALGGTPQEWKDGPTAGLWEVFTTTSEIDVIVPPGPAPVDSWFEMWRANMCVRRCDGEREQKSNGSCLCPADQEQRAAQAAKGESCRMTTRVNVMIPTLPGVGVWMLESHGFYAASELTGVAEILAGAGNRGVVIPARLRIEQRERRIYKGEGQAAETRKFPVPVLEVLASLQEIASGSQRLTLAGVLPSTAPALTAVGGGLPERPAIAGSVSPAQALLERGVAATTSDELRQVYYDADACGALDEFVEVAGEDALEMLREFLKARKVALESTVGAVR